MNARTRFVRPESNVRGLLKRYAEPAFIGARAFARLVAKHFIPYAFGKTDPMDIYPETASVTAATR